MNKTLYHLLAAAALALAAPAQASIVDFDALNADASLSSLEDFNPYAGLTWSQWFLGDTGVEGYDNAAHSGSNYVMNGYGVDALEVASASAFHFTGAWFVAPNINGARASWVNISAYDSADGLIGSTGNIAIDTSYRWVAADFANATRLVVSRDEGFFAMDDVTFASASPVPEPATVTLFGAGALGLCLWRRQRRA
ncbi:MAG: PEP-CTERM sorting domain-containing protein [Gammaproteobacteria bacterium]